MSINNYLQPESTMAFGQKSLFRKLIGLNSIKLVLALVGIFFFFVFAIGIQAMVKTSSANKKIISEYRQKGEQPPKLSSPLSQGWEASSRFLGRRNLETISRQTTIVGIASLGATLIIISAGIDLSVGSIVALGTVVIAWFLNKTFPAINPVWAAVVAVIVCSLFGLLNGLLITSLKVVPFIVTLGMMLFVRGAAKGLANEQKIDAPDTWLNNILASLPPDKSWMLVPAGVWILIICSIIISLLLRYTRFGRHTFAIGSNEQTARLCGVAVERTKLWIYLLGGLFGGLAGLMQFSRLTVGDPTVAIGLELDVIAAVVIGGGSLSGGEGSILGSIVGALILMVIASGCSQMGLENWVQQIITGTIIIVAVALDRLRHRRES